MASLVKDHGHMGWCIRASVVFDIALKHVAKAAHGTDRQPIRFAGQRRQGVVGAKDERRSVDQMQVTTFAELKCHCLGLLRAVQHLCHAQPRGARRDPKARLAAHYIFDWVRVSIGSITTRDVVSRRGSDQALAASS